MVRSSYSPRTGHDQEPEDDSELELSAQRRRPTAVRAAERMFDQDGDWHADAAPGSIQRFMPYDGTWHMAPADWGIAFNAMMRRYEFVPPR